MTRMWSGTLPDCFFFFQAEDGIRDLTVTGVQTCALPICLAALDDRLPSRRLHRDPAGGKAAEHLTEEIAGQHAHRSEERRVGKECRSWWSSAHHKIRRRIRSSIVAIMWCADLGDEN